MSGRLFAVTVGESRTSKKWKGTSTEWPAFAERCANTKRTNETAAEYAAMTRAERGAIKDVGGYVAGTLNGTQRKAENILSRSMLTLDLDFVNRPAAALWDEIDKELEFTEGLTLLCYSSHSHTETAPRLRLVIPTSRDMNPAEYEAVARTVAQQIGIDQFDDTTYQPARLMYWPSTSKDAPFFYRRKDGQLLDPDKVLAMYDDWRDTALWPTSSRETSAPRREIKKVGDPRQKTGGDGRIIAAFCTAYSIEDAIEKHLDNIYRPGTITGRYSYIPGESTNGVVCYDGLFAYSHHGTDPAHGQLCNAFDLVRIHKYGDLDKKGADEAGDVTRLPSYKAMKEYAENDSKVKILLTQNAAADFADVDLQDEDEQWRERLDLDKKGEIKPTIPNFCLILENDRKLKDHFRLNELSQYIEAEGLPWKREPAQWVDSDDANLRGYVEDHYRLSSKEKLTDAFTIVATKHKRHPVREYLKGLQWDGVPRLERVIISHLGAKDNALNRALTRKHFVAAVARVMKPGCKYDTCLTLTGPEGTGKSSLFRIMGGAWFDDSITTIEGKEGRESLRGKWIIELAELSGIKRSEVEAIKNYLSNAVDSYRGAYERRVTRYPRQCVFCATTNENRFLKGDTGNRRFWVIQIEPELATGGTLTQRMDHLEQTRDQLWAEALHYYQQGERLWLNEDEAHQLAESQESFNDDGDDPTAELLHQFLNKKLPTEWPVWDLRRRQAYLNNPDPLDPVGVETREIFCIPEFLCERIGLDMADRDYRYRARKIAKLMEKETDWQPITSTRHTQKLYGRQRGYRRITEPRETEGTDDDL